MKWDTGIFQNDSHLCCFALILQSIVGLTSGPFPTTVTGLILRPLHASSIFELEIKGFLTVDFDGSYLNEDGSVRSKYANDLPTCT